MSESVTSSEGHSYTDIQTRLGSFLEPRGFEIHPFLVGWYNSSVGERFKLKYDDSTLVFLVLSKPDMFELTLLPFLNNDSPDSSLDLVDACMRTQMSDVRDQFSGDILDIIHDFEIGHNRRPRLLVQTAGHVSGAAYYYQRSDVSIQPWPESKSIFGVSIHPQLGGWFAFRSAIVFRDVLCPNLPRKSPPDVVEGDEKRIELLNNFNNNWQDWKYRDIIPVIAKYSEKQKTYFATLPKDRKELIAQWMENEKLCDGF